MNCLLVTVLLGFIGAAKTTLLNNSEGLRVAVMVNDMSEGNINTELVAAGTNLSRLEGKLAEFSSGCISCSLREDLIVEVAKLAELGRFDYLLVESTGISEPIPVAETFLLGGLDGVATRRSSRVRRLTHHQQVRPGVSSTDRLAGNAPQTTESIHPDSARIARMGWPEGDS